MKNALFLALFSLLIAACSISGDKRVDVMLEKMKVEVIHDIPADEDSMAGNHIGSKIHMKPRSAYSKHQQYFIVLLHEIGHHLGAITKRESYKCYTQERCRLLEELVANKYSIFMTKRLGYELNFSYDELNEQYTNTLISRFGYTKAQVNAYVSKELKRSVAISNKLIKGVKK